MKVKKLDRRMKGFGSFKYKITFRKRSDRAKFIEVRNWCWAQWDSSSEHELWDINVNQHWAWIIDEWETKILLASDKEAQWFTLKWG